MASLKVLVSGFPNSGTSFLANLVSGMGFSPGPHENLKGANGHNPFGYWEHREIRDCVWSLIGSKFNEDRIPSQPLKLGSKERKVAEQVAALAKRDKVEMYKDVALPIVYRIFPPDAKYLIIQRSWVTIWERYYRREPRESFHAKYERYDALVYQMAQEVSTCVVRYEEFKGSLDASMMQVAGFLGLSWGKLSVVRLRKIWRPRWN